VADQDSQERTLREQAPPALDAEIAQAIFGWTRVSDPASGDGQGYYWTTDEGDIRQPSRLPPYSTDISHAWCVVEAMCRYPNESVRRCFLDRLWQAGLLLERELASKNICLAALAAIDQHRAESPMRRDLEYDPQAI
jgi:hypothetical protein